MVLIREVMYGNVLFSQQPVTFLMMYLNWCLTCKGQCVHLQQNVCVFSIYTPHCYDALRYWPYYKVV